MTAMRKGGRAVTDMLASPAETMKPPCNFKHGTRCTYQGWRTVEADGAEPPSSEVSARDRPIGDLTCPAYG
jgi:hypothetical protein